MYTFRHGVTESTQYLILAEISRQSANNVSNYVLLCHGITQACNEITFNAIQSKVKIDS